MSIRINYKDYPEFMFAMIASYLPESEGDDIRRLAGSVVFRHEDKDGNTYKNGVLHSYDDKPAYTYPFGKQWYKDGKIHRDNDKPAYVYKNTKKWYKDGELHRDNDLPAVINERHRDGDWYIIKKLKLN